VSGAHENKGQGAAGGAILLGLLAFALVGFPGRASESPRPKERGVVAYHVMRFWGLKPQASRAVLEQEAHRAARKHGISPNIFRALVRVESAWNPKAVSRVGARGLSQVMPANARRCGLKTPEELWDPVKNLHCGAQILAEDLKTYGGDMRNALKSYNCGKINCPPAEQYAAKVLELAGRG
jgi:soluble lytic murein transglycosylase-like protein